jgi:dTDP-4-dehydrorhamnose reductase
LKRLLVTGASGFLGWNVCKIAASSWQVFGTARSHSVKIDGVSMNSVDLCDQTEVRELFRRVRPHAVIHLAAASQPNFCQTQPEQSRRINVDVPIFMSSLAAEKDIPFVFSSTDLVFDGRHAPYAENDPVCPLSVYGEQKVAAELGVRQRNPDAVVCRMSLMFGDAPSTASSFIQPLVAALRQAKPIDMFVDEYRTAASAISSARGLLLALDKQVPLLHLGGRERISRYDFARKLAALLGADASLVRPKNQRDVAAAAPRPSDVSLDSTKAFALGYNPLTVDEELCRLACVRP